MAINWDKLKKDTADYNTLTLSKGSDGSTVKDIIFSGLQVKLSELVANFPSDGGSSMAIWADTLIIDYPTFNSVGTVIIAREIDISQLAGSAMPMRVPKEGTTAVSEFFIGKTKDGAPFSLTTTKVMDGASVFTVATKTDRPTISYFYLNSDAGYNSENHTTYSQFKDLLNRPWALNSLQASFAVASELVTMSDQESVHTGKSMLQWVISCIGLLGMEGNTIPADFAELYGQALALNTTVKIKSGTYYVPVLSSDFYSTQAGKLLTALDSYESGFNLLTTSENIDQAVKDIGGTLEKVAGLQQIPLQTDLDNVVQNATTLGNSIQELRFQYDIQDLIATNCRNKMEIEIRNADQKRYMKAFFETAINVAKVGIDIGKIAAKSPDASPGAALKDGAEAVKSVYTMYQMATKDYKSDSLVQAAQKLVAAQRAIADSFLASAGIWDELKNNKPITSWPETNSGDTFDADLVWNNYQIEAERVLSNLNRSAIGDDEFSGPAQEAATNYLAALKVLIQYGKAINSKMVAYSTLLSRAIILKSEIVANQKIQDNWELLKNKSNSELEKLAALKGVLKSRMNAIKRSIYVAWINYRSSYLYLYFENPPSNTNIDTRMDAASLKSAFANVSDWIGRLLTTVSDENKITLPNEDVPISFIFPIVKDSYNNPLPTNETFAFLIPATDNKPARITVSIPRSTTQLIGVLPNKGQLPIWIKTARFFVEGTKPNNKGNVIFKASTSGSYQNGFPPSKMFSFETNGMESSFGYIAQNNSPYINWNINPAVYMTPSPFTQWTLTFDEEGGDPSDAKVLKIDFTVSFLSKT